MLRQVSTLYKLQQVSIVIHASVIYIPALHTQN